MGGGKRKGRLRKSLDLPNMALNQNASSGTSSWGSPLAATGIGCESSGFPSPRDCKGLSLQKW